jgi:membrane dipeptidase
MLDWMKTDPKQVFQRELEAILSQLQLNADVIRQAFSAGDVEKNHRDGMMSAILTIEGPAGFGFDAALLQDLYAVGFRMTTLGWNEKNVLAGSHRTGGGLTDMGREYLKEAQRLGMIIDVSHISDEAFWDIIKVTEKPIIASHSNSRAVWDTSRNLTDDMFRAICETGGVAGFNQYTDFIGDPCDLDTACDHILHWLELDPEGEHIALGGDLDGCDEIPAGFEGIQSYPVLADRMLARGFTEGMIHDIFWNNAFAVMDRVSGK